MLAYLFWHWKAADVPTEHYETRLQYFHAALAAAPPDGFRRSLSFGIAGAAWAANGGAAYEDWYIVADSAALDPLNAAAVDPARRAQHDPIAASVRDGTGGLYRLRRGDPDAIEAQFAHWFAKPASMTYPDLYVLLDPVVADSAAVLWGRQMTLGPAREFCLHSATPVELPAPLAPRTLPLRRVWPEQP